MAIFVIEQLGVKNTIIDVFLAGWSLDQLFADLLNSAGVGCRIRCVRKGD